MGEISQELAQRMADCLRAYVNGDETAFHKKTGMSVYASMRDIVAELPVPVDPDLIEARQLVHDRSDGKTERQYRSFVLAGAEDDSPAVCNTLAAIKRGRELERSGK